MERRPGANNGAKIHARCAGVGWFSADAKGQQKFAVWCEFANGVTQVIRAIDGVVWTNENPVGARKDIFAPGTNECAVRLEDHQGTIATGENINAVLRISGD